MADALAVMLLVSRSNDVEIVRTDTAKVLNGYDDTASRLIPPGLPTECPVMTSTPEGNTASHRLAGLLAEQLKDTFFQQFPAFLKFLPRVTRTTAVGS